MANRVAVDNVEPDPNSGISVTATPNVDKEVEISTKPSKKSGREVCQAASEKAKFKESLTEPTTDQEIINKSRSSALSAFLAFPKNAHFAGEQADEEIILLMRAHIITTVPWLVASLLLALVPLILLPILTAAGITFVAPGLVFVLILLWYMGIFSYAFINLLYWYFNVYIVTNERIVDVDWYSLVNHEVNVSEIKKIQDITANQIGVLSSIFDYGHVYVQTAGTEPNFEFLNVPHPQLVARKLQELLEASGGEEFNP